MIGKVYLIENSINGKKYVGKTYNSLEERFNQHIRDSKKGLVNRPLYRAFIKYGNESFSIHLLGEYEEGVLEEKEMEFISKYDTYKNGYNATLGGDGRRHFDFTDSEVVKKYEELRFVNSTAKHFDCDVATIRKILKSNNVIIEKHHTNDIKRTIMMDMNDNIIKSFKNYFEATAYLLVNKYTNSKPETVRKGIGKVVIGHRKSYLGFKWIKK